MNLDKRLLRLAMESRYLLALVVGLGSIGGLLTVMQADLLSQVVKRVFLDQMSFPGVARLLVILLGVILLRAVLFWVYEASAHAVAARIKTTLRSALVRNLFRLGPLHAHDERTGELTGLLTEGIEGLELYFSQYLPGLVLAVLIPLITLAFIIPTDPLSGLVLLFTAPLIPIFIILISNLAQTLTRRQWRSLSRMSAYFLDVLQGLTTLKTLGQSRTQVEVVEQVSDRYRRVTMSVLRVTFLSALVLEMVATLSTAVVAVEVGLRLLYGRMPFDQALFVLLLAPEFYLPLRMLGVRFHAGMSGVEAAKRIFEVLERPLAGREQPATCKQLVVKNKVGLGEIRRICFEDVHFDYGDERSALRGVSFQISTGQKVALVGPSGAGKSTIANLLLRFAEPGGGTITANGIPLQDIAIESWRQQVAWVPQNPYLFNDTVEANLRLVRPDADRIEIIQAAKMAQAHEFIKALPQGYGTVIGERGARLSGGQAQRLSLARAFLKDAPILILDEPTGELDPAIETLLQDTLDRLLVGRTALIIAHRLNTVARADQVFVFNSGKIVESGKHRDLLRQPGLYRQLVNAGRGQVDDPPSVQEIKTTSSHGSWLPVTPPTRSQSTGLFSSIPESSPSLSFYSLPTLANLARLLGLLRPFAGWIALSVLMGFAAVGSGIGLLAASAYIISAAALHPSIADLQIAIVAVRFFGIARGVFRYLERYLSHQATFRLLTHLRVWFYRSLEPLAPARLLQYRSGDLLTRLVGDIELLENFYLRALAPPLVAFLVSIAASLFLFSFSPQLGLTLIAFHALAGVCLPLLIHVFSRHSGRQTVIARAKLSADIVTGVQGMAELLSFSQSESHITRILEQDTNLSKAQKNIAWTNAAGTALSSLLAHLCMWVVLLLSIPMVGQGQFEGVYLAVLALSALSSFEAIMLLPSAAQHLKMNLQAAERLFEIVDAQPEVLSPPDSRPWPDTASLDVRRLRFRYPPPLGLSGEVGRSLVSGYHDRPLVLKDISFSLTPGRRIAIVGPSGAGKSTMVHLLLRFWDYEEGQILLGGEDLRSLSLDDLRGNLSVVSQNAYLFNASVIDNLRLARPQANAEEIVWVAKQAQIHDFVRSLPQGYDTWIGEAGVRLSAGQCQRLAIARALLKNASILILDEPTANLDPITEAQVLESLYRSMEGRSTIMVTHRLVGMEHMDEILVLQAGRVVERGRHDELLCAGGLYRFLWDLQHQYLVE